MLRRVSAASVALLFVLLALAPPARATVMLAMSVDELARTSDAVVRGRVVRLEPRRTDAGIVTHVTLAVSEWWAGSDRGARGATVELCVHGGRIGQVATFVDGQASFRQGEDVVVFLFRGGDALWPQGMSQGMWLVRDGARVDSQADAAAIVRRDARGALVPVPAATARPSMSLAELRARVTAARGE